MRHFGDVELGLKKVETGSYKTLSEDRCYLISRTNKSYIMSLWITFSQI